MRDNLAVFPYALPRRLAKETPRNACSFCDMHGDGQVNPAWRAICARELGANPLMLFRGPGEELPALALGGVCDRNSERRERVAQAVRFAEIHCRTSLLSRFEQGCGSRAQLLQRPVRAAQTLGAEVELGAVLRLEGQVAKCQRIESLLDELGDAEEVSGRLRHSRAGQQKQPAVHPLIDDAMAGHALRLCE